MYMHDKEPCSHESQSDQLKAYMYVWYILQLAKELVYVMNLWIFNHQHYWDGIAKYFLELGIDLNHESFSVCLLLHEVQVLAFSPKLSEVKI